MHGETAGTGPHGTASKGIILSADKPAKAVEETVEEVVDTARTPSSRQLT